LYAANIFHADIFIIVRNREYFAEIVCKEEIYVPVPDPCHRIQEFPLQDPNYVHSASLQLLITNMMDAIILGMALEDAKVEMLMEVCAASIGVFSAFQNGQVLIAWMIIGFATIDVIVFQEQIDLARLHDQFHT
jgi:hypothetical protein